MERIKWVGLIERERIHGSLYTSTEVFHEEMRRIFHGGWVFVGHESEIPEPGDYITRDLGLEPVLMVRNRDREVRVFSNRCTHRGNKLLSEESGRVRALSCLYHGWGFSLDGDLRGMPYPGGFCGDKSKLGLDAPRVGVYQGFVFATFNPDSPSLDEHLGHAKGQIDRAVAMSPTGRLRLDAGWVKHSFEANWKMLPENDTDGYHANHVHSSLLRVFRSQYDALKGKEDERASRVVDWGGGHTAIDASGVYSRPFEWLGTTADKVSDYARTMVACLGEEAANRLFVEGPPHVVIFPNLFLAEMNIVIFQPISPGRSIQWHTPMLLDGAPDSFNARIIRQSEGALGPSGFLLPDDQIISERQQLALGGRSGWLDISRGLNREVRSADGVVRSHISDETTNRGFWSHYKTVMERA